MYEKIFSYIGIYSYDFRVNFPIANKVRKWQWGKKIHAREGKVGEKSVAYKLPMEFIAVVILYIDGYWWYLHVAAWRRKTNGLGNAIAANEW